MSIYIHNIANMDNFSVGAPYDLTDHLSRVTILRGKIVDAEDCILLNSKTHTDVSPYQKTFNAGTYRITYLYGASRTSVGSGWGYWFSTFYYFCYTSTSNKMPGFSTPFIDYGSILNMEDTFRGSYIDVALSGTVDFFYTDNAYGDNEGSIIYHFEKIA